MKPVLILAFVSALAPPAAAADWQVAERHDPAAGTEMPTARADSETGHAFEIHRDPAGVVHARFSLGERLNGLANGHCPTFQVDDRGPQNSVAANGGCDSRRHEAVYTLGRIDGNRLISRPVYELMHGSSLVFRFHLESGGYEETRFTLNGSKRALRSVLGANVEVVPD